MGGSPLIIIQNGRCNMKERVIYRNCVDCGKEFAIGLGFQRHIAEQGLKLPKRCKECRTERRKAHAVKQCVDCGEAFTITRNEHKYYTERGLTEPKRCPDCRAKRRNGGNYGPADKEQK